LKGAPYTLLNINNNDFQINERRVQYDIKKLKHEVKTSDLFVSAPVWVGIILEEIDTAFDRGLPFLKFTKNYANKINDNIRPYSVKT